MKKYAEGLYSKKYNLDLAKLTDSSIQIYEMVTAHLPDPKFDSYDEATYSTNQFFFQYNFLMYPLPEVHNLYETIKEFFYECQIKLYGKPLKKHYYIQSWVNVYHKGQFLDWHSHGKTAAYAWHGFFCVNTENSKTSYQFRNSSDIIDVDSEDNLLVLCKSNTDFHRTYPWHDETNPRITVAFDIVPEQTILRLNGKKNDTVKLTNMVEKYPYFKNHWIPI